MSQPEVRKQAKYVPLTRDQFRSRFFARFQDPVFKEVADELERVCERAWDSYIEYRKSPNTTKAGEEFAEPDFDLPVEWLDTRAAIARARARQEDPASPTRILLVLGSTRTEHSCPGEISKTRRLLQHAESILTAESDVEVDVLDLSTLADEPMKVIYPCKACVSTAMPLCHWPCSCYPNHALGQTGDWMAELYPRWVAAHGVMILCPVHWYQAPASLKLMIDRLVCADGGNPDPTTTNGKDPARAKAVELEGWDYPKHLEGRAFSVVAHGDAAGPENLRRMLVDWCTDIGMISAGPTAQIDTWIGWYKPYATSHQDLDKDEDVFVEVGNAASTLLTMTRQIRSGAYEAPDAGLRDPRQK
jgi:multimeric flavodoxin WrbA